MKRAIVQVDEGVLYEGEWVKGDKGVRMGRGV